MQPSKVDRLAPHKAMPWHARPWQQLMTLVENDRLPQVILLSAHQHMGLADFAQAWCAYLQCEQATEAACGYCNSCQAMQAHQHPDFHLLQPEERVLTVEQVRALLPTLQQTPYQRRHVVLVNPCESMHRRAVDILLKTLEEPNPRVFFVLLTEFKRGLPKTLISRCWELNWCEPQPSAVKTWLRQYAETAEACLEAYRFANGQPGLARDLLQQDDLLAAYRQRQEQFLQFIASKISLVQVASTWSKWPIRDNIDCLLRMVQAIIKTQLLESKPNNGYGSAKITDLFAFCQLLYDNKRSLLQGATLNELIHTEQMLVKFQRVLRGAHCDPTS